jgi:aryl-alcohol dehydrogenase-like predicted oxidoreductase
MEQPQYNMFHRERFEKEYKNLYRKYGLGTTIWSPLAGGILTGKYNEGIPEGSRLDMKNNWIIERYKSDLASSEGQVKIQKVKQLQGVAQEMNTSVTQLAIAWCLKNPNVSTVILGI